MPTYEYRCTACQRPATLFFRSFASVESDPACPHCGAHALQRRMSRAFIRRGGSATPDIMPDEMYGDVPVVHGGGAYGDGWEELGAAGAGDEGGDDEDVVALARQAREMAAMMGEPLDADFDRALQHIEHGADVDDVLGDLDAREQRSTDAGGHAEGPSPTAITASDDP